jgi:hypothetical protein
VMLPTAEPPAAARDLVAEITGAISLVEATP